MGTARGLALVVCPEDIRGTDIFEGSLVRDAGFELQVISDPAVAVQRVGVHGEVALVMAFHHVTTMPQLGMDYDAAELVQAALDSGDGVPVITFSEGYGDARLAWSHRIPHLVMGFDGLCLPRDIAKEGSLLEALRAVGIEI
ncbi:hypothetical protein JKY72_00855 [Candidatus Gracilibacteria bacterium]|nr:hypothetical protein [Candidatus Gracilibacteria bacterium]